MRGRVLSLLEVHEAGVQFGGVQALAGVNLAVHPAEIVGLIGPNGAGKTTLVNAIAGSLRLTRGSVVFDGRDMSRMPAHRRSRAGISRTFQKVAVFPRLTVQENVRIGGYRFLRSGFLLDATGLSGWRRDERMIDRRVGALLRHLNMWELRQLRAGDLPLGQQRGVELARALCSHPSLVLLDEPASGLDTAETEALAATLGSVRTELDTAILLIDHDIGFVAGVADYIYVLDFGVVIAEGEPEQVLNDPRVEAAYLGAKKGEPHVASCG